MTWLKALVPRDLRAFIALWASIGGTMALTAFAIWLVWILWRGGWAVGTEIARIEKIGLIAILIIVIMGITMTGLGLAINRRQLRGKAFGAEFEASGGDDAAPAAAQAVAEAAVVKADQITEEAKP
jgi:hypothetical protein